MANAGLRGRKLARINRRAPKRNRSRPYRSVVDFTQSHVVDVNTVNGKEADDFVTRMGFGELLTLKR